MAEHQQFLDCQHPLNPTAEVLMIPKCLGGATELGCTACVELRPSDRTYQSPDISELCGDDEYRAIGVVNDLAGAEAALHGPISASSRYLLALLDALDKEGITNYVISVNDSMDRIANDRLDLK